jgi:hypothetical protein
MSADSLPLTVLVPETAGETIDIFDQHAALHIAVVERSGATSLKSEWDTPGMYLLLDPVQADGSFAAYVGKAPAGIRARIAQHVKGKDHWTRAMLIRRDTTYGLNSAQIGWLEGRFYDLLDAAGSAHLHNGNRPSDETLAPYERQMLELIILPVSRVLRLLGYDPSTPDDVPMAAKKSPRNPKFFGITVKQLIDAGAVQPGPVVSTNGAWPATAEVTADGRVRWQGKVYDNPSGAACAVKGGAANGWDFWAFETPTGKVSLATLRARHLDHLKATTHDVERPPTA